MIEVSLFVLYNLIALVFIVIATVGRPWRRENVTADATEYILLVFFLALIWPISVCFFIFESL